MSAVLQGAGKLALYFVRRSVGLYDQFTRDGLDTDLDFHGAPLDAGRFLMRGDS
jgi:hypothetical protein